MVRKSFRINLYVKKDECRALHLVLEHSSTVLSERVFSGIRAHKTAFIDIISSHGLRRTPPVPNLECFRVSLIYIEKFAEEYNMVEQHRKHHIMRDALRQLALYGTISPEQALAKELCRNSTYKAGRKQKSKSICETETAKTAPVNTALLVCLKGKKDPRALFGQEHHGDLHYAMSLEVSRFVAGTRTNLADAEYDWSLVPPSEYPKVIRDSSSLVDLKTLLRQVNPALVDK